MLSRVTSCLSLFPLLLVLSLVVSVVVSSVDELEGDILLPSSQLHRPSLANANRINPLLNVLRSSFGDRSFPDTDTNTNDGNGNGQDERYQRLYPHFRRQRYSGDDEEEEEDDPLVDGDESGEDEPVVLVRLHIEPKEEKEEELETKFVRLFIGTRPKRSSSSADAKPRHW